MARAARVLLSVPASSGVLERDFNTTGRLITAARSRLDAAYAEMVLFLNGNQKYIPQEVLALSAEQALQAVHKRLSDPRPEIQGLPSANTKQDNNFDECAVEMSSLCLSSLLAIFAFVLTRSTSYEVVFRTQVVSCSVFNYWIERVGIVV